MNVGRAGVTSLALDSNAKPLVSYYDLDGRALNFAQEFLQPIIYRGDRIGVLSPVQGAGLPWTDPEPVLSQASPSLLFYRVSGTDRIILKKEGNSITILP
jgi:hypothetical protein